MTTLNTLNGGPFIPGSRNCIRSFSKLIDNAQPAFFRDSEANLPFCDTVRKASVHEVCRSRQSSMGDGDGAIVGAKTANARRSRFIKCRRLGARLEYAGLTPL